MTDTQRKWIAVGFGLVALATLGAELLFGASSVPSPPSLLTYPTPEQNIPKVDNFRLDRLTVFFKADTSTNARALVVRDIGGTLLSYDPGLRMADIQITPRYDLQDLQRVIDKVNKDAAVQFAAPDTILQYY